MNKYINAEKLITIIEERKAQQDQWVNRYHDPINQGISQELTEILSIIASLQQEQPVNIIQWTGNNLKEVIDFTGKSPRFEEWFKSWEEFETYVHQHSDILKLFCEDGSHYEVPKGAWIVKTPDGYNLPSVAKYIHKEQPAESDVIKGGDFISDGKRVFLVLANVKERNLGETGSTFCEGHILGVDGVVYCNGDNFKKFKRATSNERAKFIHDLKVGVELKEQPAEWSKEDEIFLGVCKNALSKYERSDKWDASIISEWLENRLKSFRPMPKQEQPEVDLGKFDKDVTKIWGRCAAEPNDSIACLHIETFNEVARHFYELGLNTRKGD